MIAAILLCTPLPAPPETVRLEGDRGGRLLAFGGRFVYASDDDKGVSHVEVIEPATARVERRFDAPGYLAGTDEEGLVFRDMTKVYSLEGQRIGRGPDDEIPALLDRGVSVWRERSPGRAIVRGGPNGVVTVTFPRGYSSFAVSPSRDLLGIVTTPLDDGPATLSLRRLRDGGRAGDQGITRNGRPVLDLDGSFAFDGEDGVILVRYAGEDRSGEHQAFVRVEILRADLRGRVTDSLGFAEVEAPSSQPVVATLPGYVAVLQQDTVLLYRTGSASVIHHGVIRSEVGSR